MIHRRFINIFIVSCCAAILAVSLSACAPILSNPLARDRQALQRPNGVAVDAAGNLYVMDLGNHRIALLNSEGKLLKSIGTFGIKAGQIYLGWDVELAPSQAAPGADGQPGRLYISNLVDQDDIVLRDAVAIFNTEGKFIQEIGVVEYPPDGSVLPYRPYAVEVDGQGRIYTADFNPLTVRVFAPDGAPLGVFFAEDGPLPAAEIGLEGLSDLVVDDEQGILYIADFYAAMIVKVAFQITPGAEHISAELLATFGEYGREEGQFSYPQGMALDKENGLLYISDQGNRRIQVLTTEGEFVRQFAPPLDQDLSNQRTALGIDDEWRDWQVLGLELAPDGNIYAVDALNNVIWVFSPEGQTLRKIEVQR